jgi:metallo-beta-lactamase family protein
MKITFWGAAQTVTGSMHQLDAGGERFLLDCGTFQGRRQLTWERNSTFPFPPQSIEAVLLSHAHIDHSGNLPTLVKRGYSGPIYTTPATADLCDPMLQDSGYLQEKDAVYLNKRAWRRKLVLGPNAPDGTIEPLYTAEDAERVLSLFRRVLLHSPTQVGADLVYETNDAGHMLGSSSLILEAKERKQRVRLVYSGDVGRRGLPVIPDPEPCPPADYVIMESTYGDRLHKDVGRVDDRIADAIRRTSERGGKIIVPAFAVGRTQQLVFVLHRLMHQKRIPNIPVFVDSPLAVKATRVFRAHQEAHDAETNAFTSRGDDPFGFDRLTYIQDVNESKALNDLHIPFVVISASGMCEGGRILHHLRNNIGDPRSTVMIMGFQAENTLGRKIVEKHAEVPIFGELMRLRAEVVTINELSGHADQSELLRWLRPAAKVLRRVFLVHGELKQQKALAVAIEEQLGIAVTIPARGDSFVL